MFAANGPSWPQGFPRCVACMNSASVRVAVAIGSSRRSICWRVSTLRLRRRTHQSTAPESSHPAPLPDVTDHAPRQKKVDHTGREQQQQAFLQNQAIRKKSPCICQASSLFCLKEPASPSNSSTGFCWLVWLALCRSPERSSILFHFTRPVSLCKNHKPFESCPSPRPRAVVP